MEEFRDIRVVHSMTLVSVCNFNKQQKFSNKICRYAYIQSTCLISKSLPEMYNGYRPSNYKHKWVLFPLNSSHVTILGRAKLALIKVSCNWKILAIDINLRLPSYSSHKLMQSQCWFYWWQLQRNLAGLRSNAIFATYCENQSIWSRTWAGYSHSPLPEDICNNETQKSAPTAFISFYRPG
jgi:hypothetical protein